MKKIFLTLGSISTTTIAIPLVVSCGAKPKNTQKTDENHTNTAKIEETKKTDDKLVYVGNKNRDEVIEWGDLINLSFEGRVGFDWNASTDFKGGTSDNYQLQIGSKRFIPGFEQQMVGLAVGQAKIVRLYFPDNYQETSLAGKPAMFKVKVNSIIGKYYKIDQTQQPSQGAKN